MVGQRTQEYLGGVVLGRWGGCSGDCVVKLGWEVKGAPGRGSGRSQEAKRGVCGPSLESDALTVGICAMEYDGKGSLGA